MGEELGGEIAAGSLVTFLESPGKTSHIVSHSRSISTISFCRFACKEEVVQVIELLIDRRVERSVGEIQGLNGLWTGSLH